VTISGTGYLVLQSFAARENQLYPNFWAINDDPLYSGVQDPVSSRRAFCRAGGRSRSLNGRQNMYSYITVGTAVRFRGEPMGLKPAR
jgi:hypothetical protein